MWLNTQSILKNSSYHTVPETMGVDDEATRETYKCHGYGYLAEKIFCPSGMKTCKTCLCNFIDSDALSKERGH